jgi:hypothetical protein
VILRERDTVIYALCVSGENYCIKISPGWLWSPVSQKKKILVE